MKITRPWTALDKRKVKDYAASGAVKRRGWQPLADELGRTLMAVRAAAQRWRYVRVRPTLTQGRSQTIRRMMKNGHSLYETAQRLRVSVSTAFRWCQKLGIETRWDATITEQGRENLRQKLRKKLQADDMPCLVEYKRMKERGEAGARWMHALYRREADILDQLEMGPKTVDLLLAALAPVAASHTRIALRRMEEKGMVKRERLKRAGGHGRAAELWSLAAGYSRQGFVREPTGARKSEPRVRKLHL